MRLRGGEKSRMFGAALFLAFLSGFALPARAQFVKIEAGASNLLPSEGGSISVQGANYTSYFGAGDVNGVFGLGSYLKTTIGSHVVTLGDQPIAFNLPTDIFDTDQFFLTRGAGITAQEGKTKIFLFGGSTAEASGMQFFQAAKVNAHAGMIYADTPLTGSLHFYSRNVISSRSTSIQAIDWRARKWLQTGLSAGVGSNQPYLAATADIERDWLSVKAAYISASDRFRRITDPSVYASEVDRENILATIKPYSNLLLTFGHQNFLQPQGTDLAAPFLRATVNQAQSTFDLAQFRFGAGLFQSRSPLGNNLADAFSAARRLTNNIDVSVNYFRTLSGPNPSDSNLSTSIRETLSPKLSLLEVVNYSQGRTNVLYGGSYISNRFTLSVDYQNVYLPFAANPLSQSVNVDFRFRLFGILQMTVQTVRSADGHYHYTASSQALTTTRFRPAKSTGDAEFKRLKYIVRGHVRDELGRPVEGAAIRIGDQFVFTNADGEFFVRWKRAGTYPLEVAFGEFLNSAPFGVISAPATARANLDADASDALIVLARK